MESRLALLAVSLFKPELQGAGLAGHVALINGLGASECVVSLGDTLHRHNLPMSLPDWKRREVAAAHGDEWIENEAISFAGFAVPWRVVRHDEMLSQPRFAETREALRSFAGKSATLAEALARDIDAFAARASRDGRELREASETYILEELAADIAFAQREPFTYIYPGKPLGTYLAMQTLALELPPILRGLERCSFLRTRMRKGRVKLVG
jgi:hypothetical protein